VRHTGGSYVLFRLVLEKKKTGKSNAGSGQDAQIKLEIHFNTSIL